MERPSVACVAVNGQLSASQRGRIRDRLHRYDVWLSKELCSLNWGDARSDLFRIGKHFDVLVRFSDRF